MLPRLFYADYAADAAADFFFRRLLAATPFRRFDAIAHVTDH